MKNNSNKNYTIITSFCIFLIASLFSNAHSASQKSYDTEYDDQLLQTLLSTEKISALPPDLRLTQQSSDELAKALEEELELPEESETPMFDFGEYYQCAGQEDEATRWYEELVKLGHTESMYKLGLIYYEKGLNDKAHELMQAAASKGNKSALLHFKSQYETCAENGSKGALCALGLVYYSLSIYEDVYTEYAKNCFARSALNGCEKCAYSFFQRYYEEAPSLSHEVDYAEMQNLWNKIIYDDQLIQNELIMCILNLITDHLIYTHKEEILDSLGKAANSDPRKINALFQLGRISQSNKDTELAIAWYTLASRRGHKFASYGLGEIYEKKNQIWEAFKYYKVAEKKGVEAASCKLGLLYYNYAKQDGILLATRKHQATKYFRNGGKANCAGCFYCLYQIRHHNFPITHEITMEKMNDLKKQTAESTSTDKYYYGMIALLMDDEEHRGQGLSSLEEAARKGYKKAKEALKRFRS